MVLAALTSKAQALCCSLQLVTPTPTPSSLKLSQTGFAEAWVAHAWLRSGPAAPPTKKPNGPKLFRPKVGPKSDLTWTVLNQCKTVNISNLQGLLSRKPRPTSVFCKSTPGPGHGLGEQASNEPCPLKHRQRQGPAPFLRRDSRPGKLRLGGADQTSVLCCREGLGWLCMPVLFS